METLYRMDAFIHDEITQLSGSHKNTMRSIEKIMAENIPLQISCPTMKINKDSYKDVLKWAHSNKSKAYTDYEMMAQSNLDDSNLQHRLDIKDTGVLLLVNGAKEPSRNKKVIKRGLDLPAPRFI